MPHEPSPIPATATELADYLRADGHRLRRLAPGETVTRELQALHVFADNSRHSSPWAAKLYADARARGERHPQAVRILGRAWLRVIWVCWHTNTAYDPAKHRAEQRLAA